MISFSGEIQKEYERCVKQVGENDPYSGQGYIGIHDVLDAHFLIADFFYLEGEGLGGVGPRDINLLHSALSRQAVGFGPHDKWNDKFSIAATLMYGLIMDHPFYDANKRTAFLSTLYYLHKMNRIPTISKKEFENFTVEIADRKLTNRRRYRELIKSGSHDPEVEFIARFLRQNTRDVDKRQYTITFRDLEKILNRYGFEFENPRHNFIDLIKVTSKRKIFGGRQPVRSRIGKIGYHSHSVQVQKGDLRHVRKITGLTHKNGCDSQSFYYGLSDLQSMLAEYQEPLRSLADR